MRHSIATVSLSGSLPEKLSAIAAARFDAVEIFENDLVFSEESPRQVARMAADAGLKISLFQPFRDFEGVPDELFRRNLDRAERKFDLMGELGAPMMLVCSNVSPAAIGDDERAAAQLHALAERAAAHGIRIGYEALAWGAHVRTYGHVWKIVQKADHSHLGVLLDSFHTLALGDDPAGIEQIPGDKIFFVQLADAPKLKMDVLTWSRHFRCFPGQGEFDVAGFVRHALKAGYDGPLSLEIFNDEFRASSARRTAADGRRSLLLLEEQLRRQAEGEPDGGRSWRRRVDLLDPPPPPELDGVAFIEFTVEGEEEAELHRWLLTLGFAKAGRHRSKDVSLYRQGDIHIALNADRESFAHSYFLMHGSAVCAVGLWADDARAALTRAEIFGCSRYEERVGAEELPMPAIRAPDGGLVYVVDRNFQFTDFLPDDGEPAKGAGLDRVDHIAQAVPADQFDSWVLYYRSVLGLKPEESWVLPDPYGLVRSRALTSENRAVRFPLNFSDSSRTAVARSLSSFAGAGVHHIAFATPDIFATVDKLRALKVSLLAIPENYYDDLIARFGLPDDMVDELRRRHILYDRSPDGGEFFHVYTEFFRGRFFFEVVQRTGGYDLYGAANAPVRMAAHAQLRRAPVELLEF
ncbi:MAG: bifunctional sugar phosphate isomerase/epimerase/4-hydroxyphenylpyruvate dioxygenase family protein [Caulobacteraceae bacterium]